MVNCIHQNQLVLVYILKKEDILQMNTGRGRRFVQLHSLRREESFATSSQAEQMIENALE